MTGSNGPLASDTCMALGPDGDVCGLKDQHEGKHDWEMPDNVVTSKPAIKTKLRAPEPDEFEGEFLESPALSKLGQELIDSCWEFEHLHDLTVLFLWKFKGGQSGGKATLGKCQKPSGLLAHFAKADYVIWIAADNARDFEMTPHQLEALLHHELAHTEVVENEQTGEQKITTKGHDVEEHRVTLERYGCWMPALKEFAQTAAKQLKLDEAMTQ